MRPSVSGGRVLERVNPEEAEADEGLTRIEDHCRVLAEVEFQKELIPSEVLSPSKDEVEGSKREGSPKNRFFVGFLLRMTCVFCHRV